MSSSPKVGRVIRLNQTETDIDGDGEYVLGVHSISHPFWEEGGECGACEAGDVGCAWCSDG